MQRQESPNKKALLVVSFGTSHQQTREKTIDAIEQHLGQAFPDRRLYRGWTSRMIVKRLRERDNIHVDTLEEALQRMQEDGITDLLVQPTHIIRGWENDRMLATLQEAAGGFDRMAVGVPLLDNRKDLENVARIFCQTFFREGTPAGQALVLMGHGTASKKQANQIYLEMEQVFRALGHDEVLVGTVEGSPSLEDLRQKLRSMHVHKVYLTPLMIVAGEHARNDMAGESEDSWCSVLGRDGYETVPVLRGLGEYPEVIGLFEKHARAAAEAEVK